jgi:hypothetical protein
MDVLIVTTESHRKLADEYFRSSMPREADVTVCEKTLDVAGQGTYESSSWQSGVTAKLHWALEYMSSASPGTMFALSDVDIQFFPEFSARALSEEFGSTGTEVLFQKEHRTSTSTEVNTGFYVARNSSWFVDVLERAAALCGEATIKNDQTAINQLLRSDELGTRWGFLPFAYYARSHGFPPRGRIVLHHANFSGSVEEKIRQLDRVRRYVNGGPLDRAHALVGEGVDVVASGKLAAALRARVCAVRQQLGGR